MTNHHKKTKHYNIKLIVIGLVAAIALSRIQGFEAFLFGFGSLGYFGVLIAGALFVSTFTVATGALLLSIFVQEFSLPVVALIAGAGGVVGDMTIFRFVRDDLADELGDLYRRFGTRHLTVLLHSKYFRWTLPVIGAIIIASPLPDELGVSLLGISKMNISQFIFLSFVLNSLGVFFFLSAWRFFTP